MSATDRQVALLRGINVGKANRVPMADLSALLGQLGCGGVRTLLNSGNAVYTPPAGAAGRPAAMAAALRAAVLQQLGVDAPVVVKTSAQWQSVVAGNTLAAAATAAGDASRLLVCLAPDAATLASLAPLADRVRPPERWLLGADAAYLHCAAGILDSAAGKALLGKLGQAVTSRNWATVLKIQTLLAG